eukprot:TRINITY_DN1308_c0_g4_i1.p1 TRINITY_DN1308_c0_g4~~TRINITY_DN1308_c0_g4_i1.p1  ORF type:complete len:423 (+),score=74.89 TRINITY_DN1308_c0_g4_i1:164-1432(+)
MARQVLRLSRILAVTFGTQGLAREATISLHGAADAPTAPQASAQLPARQLMRSERSDTGETTSSHAAGRASEASFIVDADPATLTWNPKTMSVILPCAEEREYAVKTVQSIYNTTDPNLLLEIIVVDDGSNPPLSQTHMNEDFQKKWKTRVLRHERTIGLIGAKKTGGDHAQGDILVFFDCHVAPQKDWYKSFKSLIAENYRRMVVPQITALDIDSWTQIGKGGGMSKCYLTWDADFKWFDSDNRYIAVISGGLLGMSQRWWKETGGYDEHMLGWGGENIDQSLRTWLCGGEIVNAEDSYVAHMWRTDADRRTKARYMHVGDAALNRARAVYAWYGEFAAKLQDYPQLNRQSMDGEPWRTLENAMRLSTRISGMLAMPIGAASAARACELGTPISACKRLPALRFTPASATCLEGTQQKPSR